MYRAMTFALTIGLTMTAVGQAAEPGQLRLARDYTPGIGQKVTLNPQPLPPKWQPDSPFSKVLLNPQPLPPRVIYTPWGKRIIRRSNSR